MLLSPLYHILPGTVNYSINHNSNRYQRKPLINPPKIVPPILNLSQTAPNTKTTSINTPINATINTAVKKIKKKSTTKKIRSRDSKSLPHINFEGCYHFEATCPFKTCPDFQNKIFLSQQDYQKHPTIQHERRDRLRNNLVWTCPECKKGCSSFYNFSAHVTGHRDLCKPPWICRLSQLKYIKITMKISRFAVREAQQKII